MSRAVHFLQPFSSMFGNHLGATKSWRVIALALMLVGVAGSSHAVPNLTFQATDLPDATAGQDLWKYSYVLSGFTFQAGQGFSVFFDSHFYADLQDPQPNPSVDWSVIAIQPDTTLQAPGFFDGQALVNSPSLSTTFSVEFVWLGQGKPGEQPMDIYDTDFSTLTSVTTVPSSGGGGGGTVPESHDCLISVSLLLVVAFSVICPRLPQPAGD